MAGMLLCVLGLAVFVYGMSNMTRLNIVSNSLLVVLGIFIGMAGFLVLMMHLFFRGSAFS